MKKCRKCKTELKEVKRKGRGINLEIYYLCPKCKNKITGCPNLLSDIFGI